MRDGFHPPHPLTQEDPPDVLSWERRKLRVWRAQGRLTDEGVLRVSHRPIRKFCAPRIKRLFKRLSPQDCQDVAAILYGDNRYRAKSRDIALPQKFQTKLAY